MEISLDRFVQSALMDKILRRSSVESLRRLESFFDGGTAGGDGDGGFVLCGKVLVLDDDDNDGGGTFFEVFFFVVEELFTTTLVDDDDDDDGLDEEEKLLFEGQVLILCPDCLHTEHGIFLF